MFCDPADTTRDRLLDTAERLFAEHGYQATTMRAVTTEAAANIAAVNYHFGSKHALLEAVVHRALRPVVWLRMRSMFAVVGAHLTGAFDSPAACPPGCDELRARLVTFLAAGLCAPATAAVVA